jgi:[acyl-carrier-protein] S-malonyltransferase
LGRDLYNKVLPVRAALDRADKALASEGFKATKACFLGSDEDLARPSIAGPACLALSFGVSEALASRHVAPQMVAGYGSGEIIALASLGALPFEESLRFLRRRGEILESAWEANPFHVAPISGLGSAELEKLLAALPKSPRIVAEDSPEDFVLAGDESVLKKVLPLLAARGLKTGRIQPGYDWPHPMFGEVAGRLADAFAAMKPQPKAWDFFSALHAGAPADFGALAGMQAGLCVQPIPFHANLARLRDAGMDTLVEIGPGQVLGALARKFDAGVRVLASFDAKSLSSALKLAV